jgi:hypothetical protein
MEYIFVKTDSQEWGDMWDFVRTHPINENLEEPCIATNNNEVWEYLGSFKNDDKVISEIRHGSHPRTNEMYKIMYQHPTFNKESISKSARII